MRDVCVTGTSSFVATEQARALSRLLSEVPTGRVRHGMCIGADAIAHSAARALNIPVVGHPGIGRDGLSPKRAELNPDSFESIRRPRWYLDRNEDMVYECTEVIALVDRDSCERYRSGEWNTIGHAIRYGRNLSMIWRSGYVAVWSQGRWF